MAFTNAQHPGAVGEPGAVERAAHNVKDAVT